MLRTASILVVFCTSLMLGKAPCCRIHDFAAPVLVQTETSPRDAHARGPGQYSCPCCDKPHRPGGQQGEGGGAVPSASRPCTCPPLIASITVDDADALDLPLALPLHLIVVAATMADDANLALEITTRASPTAHPAVTLPLLL